uniref:Uncharacterized protein n=1 Tax=Lotharella globosa TaxID=91324 RepID=A0A7S3YPH1_9EUKA|mmetsp:Transcript_22330/g.44834  ORF Transcript_22330/g.44834 Transcript_22330/m.44834 type:complete len:513 (+) Transcript_22330:15-1553(+)
MGSIKAWETLALALAIFFGIRLLTAPTDNRMLPLRFLPTRVARLQIPGQAMRPRLRPAQRKFQSNVYKVTSESVDRMVSTYDTILGNEKDLQGPPRLPNFRKTAAENWRDSVFSVKTATSVPGIDAINEEGTATLETLTLPNKKQEPFRHLSLRRIFNNRFAYSSGSVDAKMLKRYQQRETEGYQLVFVDGEYSEDLSVVGSLPQGVYVGGLASCPPEIREKVHEKARVVPQDIYGSEYWATLNKAMLKDIAVVYVPEGVTVEDHIQFTFYTSSSGNTKGTVSFPRMVIISEKESDATVLVNHMGEMGTKYYSAPVTTVDVGFDAHMTVYYHQHQSLSAMHTEVINATVEEDGHFKWVGMLTGASVGRINMDVDLIGEDAEAEVYGASICSEGLELDMHAFIRHHGNHSISKQEHRTIVGPKSHGVFRGQILVLKDALGVDCDQQSRALLLANDGEVANPRYFTGIHLSSPSHLQIIRACSSNPIIPYQVFVYSVRELRVCGPARVDRQRVG